MSAMNHEGSHEGKERKTISSAGQNKKRLNNQQKKARPKSVQESETAAIRPSKVLKDREEQFRKANEELEKKTAVLVKQAEEMIKMGSETPRIGDGTTIMSDDDDDIDVQQPIRGKPEKHNTATKRKSQKIDPMADELISMDIERTVKELERKLEAEGLPGGGTQPSTSEPDYVSEDLGSEAMIRFLKAKLRVLQEEHDQLCQEMSQKEKDLVVAEAKVKEVTEINSKLEKSQQSTQQQIGKYQKLAREAQMKCEGLEGQLISLKRVKKKPEFEAQKSNFRKTTATEGAVKVRLNRALEEVDKYKTLFNRLKADTKDSAKNDKTRIEELENENKILERQKGELITAFKKQMKLIDVLKRQKVHLEAARMLTFTEEEFMKALDTGKQS